MFKKQLIILFALAMTGLAACGTGDDSAAASTAISEMAIGSVSGFGSIIIDGTRYNDEQTLVTQEMTAGAVQNLSLDAVELGMQVELIAAGDAAQSVVIQTTLVAPIESISVDGFVAAGQTVRVQANTLYHGASGLADLVAGSYVAVHGSRDAGDMIIADLIRLRDPDADRLLRIVGAVRDLDTRNKTFDLGALTVNYADDPRIFPAGASLAEGSLVVVFSQSAPVAGVLTANGVRVLRSDLGDGRRIRVAGLIRDLDPVALTFRLHMATIDASSAEFVNGSAAQLANGRRARILGTVKIDQNGVRTIKADKVWTLAEPGEPTSVAGFVRNYVSPASFTVRGVTIDASGDSVQFLNGSVDNLAENVWIRVRGVPDGDKVVAQSIEFYDSNPDRTRTVAGFIRGYDAASGGFQIFLASVNVTSETQVFNGDGGAASASAIENGLWAVVSGKVRAGTFVAEQIRLRNSVSVVVNRIEGVAYQIDAGNRRFRINGIAVRAGDQVLASGTFNNLRTGHRIRVNGIWVDGELWVNSIVRL